MAKIASCKIITRIFIDIVAMLQDISSHGQIKHNSVGNRGRYSPRDQTRRKAQRKKIMLNTTLEIVRSGLKADPTLTPQERARLLAALRTPAAQKPAPVISTELRLIRRAEVARRLSCCLRMVDKLAANGILIKRKLPGRVRAAGFLASDVDSLIADSGKQNGGEQ